MRKRENRPWKDRKWAVIEATTAKRLALLRLLSPDRRCAECQKRKRSYDGLEIDHVDGDRTWRAAAKSRWSRIAHYWRDYRAGVKLRALCRKCNAKHGRARQMWGHRPPYATTEAKAVAA